MEAVPGQRHFIPKEGESPFFQFMLQHLEFFVTYLSVHYPFTVDEIQRYWDVLSPGTAYYPVYLPDTGSNYISSLGLCFNQNIRWTDKLRSRWQMGFSDPFNGYLFGIGTKPVEYDDGEKFRSLLPLNLDQHWRDREQARMYSILDVEAYFNSPAVAEHDELDAKVGQSFSRMSFDKFRELHNRIGKFLVYNRSIWYNTLCYEIEEQDIFRLLRLRRYYLYTIKSNEL